MFGNGRVVDACMSQLLQSIFLVGGGGAIGAILRFLVGQATNRFFGPTFPLGTLFVNAAGSMLMGMLFVVLVLERTGDSRLAAVLMTGLLGGFTTFSAFSLDFYVLLSDRRLVGATCYVLGSVGLSIGLFFAGVWMVRSWLM